MEKLLEYDFKTKGGSIKINYLTTILTSIAQVCKKEDVQSLSRKKRKEEKINEIIYV